MSVSQFDVANFSGVLGWVSIACWIVVYSPQIIENYRRKSGEGLSVSFVLVWLLGDLFNLVGAALAGLIPTVIILAIYYSFCDLILLCQIYYYRWLTTEKARVTSPQCPPGEDLPLLHGDKADERIRPTRWHFVCQAVVLLLVLGTGAIASWISGDHLKDRREDPKHPEWMIQVIGWLSAILYLGARFPQIVKNFETRCEGLSPALFLFAILGNTTYALSICAESMEHNYLIMNASWLAGSALTVFLDLAVLSQFYYYRSIAHVVT